MTKFLFIIDKETLQKVKAEAKTLGMSVGAFIRKLIADYFK